MERGFSALSINGDVGLPLSEKALRRQAKELEKQKRKAEVTTLLAAEKEARDASVNDCAKGQYGVLPVNMSQNDNGRPAQPWENISSICAARANQTVVLRARIHAKRTTGGKLCFFVLRQQFNTIQAVVAVDEVDISRPMIKFASKVTNESIVIVRARIVVPFEPVKSCSVQDAELAIISFYVESAAPEILPFTIENASRPETEAETETETTEGASAAAESSAMGTDSQTVPAIARVLLDTRLNNRILDLRTATNHAIFRIQSGVCRLFREFLDKLDFVEIHTPKLLGAASEGGASVFEVKYFRGVAYLAQSPQFYKQMMITADFPRVYEIGPVFRAENANTHRHMTEFTGLDLEISIERDYTEVLDLFDGLFRHIFAGLEDRYARELETVRRQYAFEPFRFDRERLLRLRYHEGVQMLRDSGVEMADDEDLSTEKERQLGRLVKEKYDTDFFMLEKYPLCVRPFYTMPCPENKMYSNSYDFFMRGEEIMSGAQRVHDKDMLHVRMTEHGVDPSSVQGYLDAFKFGAPPHAGGGIGLERIVMLYLCLNNIRRATLFPRDPSRLEP